MTLPKHIETPRLPLRPLRPKHVWFYRDLIGNPETRRYLGGPVRGLAALKHFRAALSPMPERSIWVVCLHDYRRSIGLIELGPHKDGTDLEVSYQFLPRIWGQGYASEALVALVDELRQKTQLPRIIAETQSANTASIALLERAGFAEVQRLNRYGTEQVIYALALRHRTDR